MTFDINLNTIIESIVAVGVGGIYREFRRMNGALRNIVQWKEDHEKASVEMHRSCQDQFHELRGKL